MAYSPFLSAVVTIDHENTIKSYSLSPSTLGRGHSLLDPGGPVWVSPFHPLLRSSGQRADDPRRTRRVRACQTTTRTLRSVLRTARVVRRMACVGHAAVAMLCVHSFHS